MEQEASESDVEEAFNKWFAESEEDDLRTSCKHCLEKELAKRKKDEDPNMSFLDRYLKEHKRH